MSDRGSGTAATPRRVALGRIAGVFGVRGWLRVESYTEPATAILDYRFWTLEAPGLAARLEVREGRPQGRHVVARLGSLEDRTAAGRWVGATIYVNRSELPPLAEREHYREDLIGLTVRTADGAVLGRVDHFIDGPVHAVMVVRGEREHWVPATPVHLKRVDLAAGEIHVDWRPLED